MKRLLTLCAGAILLVATGCDTADTMGPENAGDLGARPVYTGDGFCDATGSGYDYCVYLIAGQTEEVGKVYYDFDGTTFRIRYELTTPGLCLDEVHYGIYNTINDVPHNRGGNVAPGGLTYGDSPAGCATSYEDEVEPSGISGGTFFVAAHAVVNGTTATTGPDCDYIYGIAKDGKIYKIRLGDINDPNDNTTEFFWDTGFSFAGGSSVTDNWPNGLALDAENRRLYFTNATALNAPTDGPDPNAPLYFVDLSGPLSQHFSGNLERRNAAATFVGTDYYYISQNLGDNLREVSFAGDGTIQDRVIACINANGGTPGERLFFGDLAYKDGVIYGSARRGADTDANLEFFKIENIDTVAQTCDYTSYGSNLVLEQLAFDCEGRLIGHNTATRTFYLVDTETGSHTAIGGLPNDLQFNDLASGECRCEPVEYDETAWGWGQTSFNQAFGGNQWGWIFGGTY